MHLNLNLNHCSSQLNRSRIHLAIAYHLQQHEVKKLELHIVHTYQKRHYRMWLK